MLTPNETMTSCLGPSWKSELEDCYTYRSGDPGEDGVFWTQQACQAHELTAAVVAGPNQASQHSSEDEGGAHDPPLPLAEDIDNQRMAARRRGSVSVKVWPLVHQSLSSGWLYTHVCL